MRLHFITCVMYMFSPYRLVPI